MLFQSEDPRLQSGFSVCFVFSILLLSGCILEATLNLLTVRQDIIKYNSVPCSILMFIIYVLRFLNGGTTKSWCSVNNPSQLINKSSVQHKELRTMISLSELNY